MTQTAAVTDSPVLRLAWATDVHLDFLDKDNLAKFFDELAAAPAEGVLITGDIADARSIERRLGTLARHLCKPVFFVLGNHDYYHNSIAEIRSRMRALTSASHWLRWLPSMEGIELAPDSALVGVDGWADGQFGNYAESKVMLNDYLFIKDLAGLGKAERLQCLRTIAAGEAELLEASLGAALKRYHRVVVATHVPPFKEACWHDGQISNDEWLPHFSCQATGLVLRRAALEHPDSVITVLCGHTHGAGVATVLPNLTVITGGAEYGAPHVQFVLDVRNLSVAPV